MSRIGILGGTFDPIHLGHVEMIRAAAMSSHFDRIVVQPCGIPPHKSIEETAFSAYRFVMVQKALAGIANVVVSDLEILRPGVTYTIDTLKDFRRSTLPGDELVLIYGSDLLFDLHNWRQPELIMREASLFLARRGGQTEISVQDQAELMRLQFGTTITFFDAPQIELSSTAVRSAIAARKSLKKMEPDSVIRFIKKHDLYQAHDAIWDLPTDLKYKLHQFERELWSLLTMRRLLHSLNVCRLAVLLAVAHKTSPEAAAIAGIFHDCAKDLPYPEILCLAEQAGDPTLMKPELAHGPASAVLARQKFGITDPEILHAIQYHTTGCCDMSVLDRIIFISDKAEPAQTFRNLNVVRSLAPIDLMQPIVSVWKALVFLWMRMGCLRCARIGGARHRMWDWGCQAPYVRGTDILRSPLRYFEPRRQWNLWKFCLLMEARIKMDAPSLR